MRPTLETIAVIFSLLSFVGGILAWYAGAVQKRYAAQRDFQHLKRSYDQLALNQATILKDMADNHNEMMKDFDSRLDAAMLEFREIKGTLQNFSGRSFNSTHKTD